MSKTLWKSAGTLGAALLASSCCIGPVLFAILGLGAFGAGAMLERLRPALMSLTFLILGIAFYSTYRKSRVSCANGRCDTRGASKWNKFTLWTVAVLALIFLSFPEWSPVLLNAKPESTTMNEAVTLYITGMTCGGCAVNIQRALDAVPGVISSSVSLESATATVTLGKTPPTLRTLIEAVEAAGYAATSAPASSTTDAP